MTTQQNTPVVLIDTPEFRVAEFSLSPGQGGTSHSHSAVSEYCYCLEGQLSVVVESEPCKMLSPGEKLFVPVNVAHQVSSMGSKTCRYLVVQGVGKFDFIPHPVASRVDPGG